MSQKLLDGAESLFIEGKQSFAFLFLHGFKATSYELKEFAYTIHKNYKATVSVPLLAGHGISAEVMNESKWTDWFATAENEYINLKQKYAKVFIIGMSMGGSLALYLATKHKPAAIVTIGSPVVLKKRYLFVYLVMLFKKNWDDSGGADIADKVEAAKVVRLNKVPLKALVQLRIFLSRLRSVLHLVDTPLLLCHSKNDHVIHYHNMDSIQRRVSSNHLEIESYEKSFHIIPLDFDRYDLFKRSIYFFNQFI